MAYQSSLHLQCCWHMWLTRWNYPNLWAPYYRIYWNQTPGATICWRGKEYGLGPGELFIIPPHTAYSCRLGEDPQQGGHEGGRYDPLASAGQGNPIPKGAVRHFVIEFFLHPAGSALKPGIYRLPCSAEMEREMLAMHQPLHGQLNACGVVSVNALIYQLLHQLPPAAWGDNLHDARLLRVTEYIEQNIASELTNPALARLCSMSANGFARLFREKTGFPVQQYIRRRRIEYALNLLANTMLSIEEVAEKCGFCDRFYFSRCFKQYIGTGPSSYRSQHG
jgi:AraC-like DNA-binding protein